MQLNQISGWFYIIGTPQRAKKLRVLMDKMSAGKWVIDEECGRCWQPPMCPTQVLYEPRDSEVLYAFSQTRKALDAWDSGRVTPQELKRYCQIIEAGKYTGAVYRRSDVLAILREEQKQWQKTSVQ